MEKSTLGWIIAVLIAGILVMANSYDRQLCSLGSDIHCNDEHDGTFR